MTFDRMCDCLQERYRRQVLMALLENPTVRPAEFEASRSAIYHIHLPKLAELNLIDWDRERGVVSRGTMYGDAEPFLELMAEHADELPLTWI